MHLRMFSDLSHKHFVTYSQSLPKTRLAVTYPHHRETAVGRLHACSSDVRRRVTKPPLSQQKHNL